MTTFNRFVGIAATAALLCTANPARAQTADTAEQLRRLDIMLMVTALRCRKGADNFQPDYERFSTTHLATMNTAARQMKAGMVKRLGAKGAERQLDRISVGMANDYGNGHPWLGCAELREVTCDLAKERDAVKLAAAADELLSMKPTGQLARLARR